MTKRLLEIDKDLFLYLNGLHAEWLDYPIFILTNTVAWVPLYVLLLYLIIKEHKKQSWIFFVGIAITIVLSDQVTSSLMKPYFERLRPSREPELQGLVHTVQNYIGGRYGFASSHAANTFGTATFIFMLLRKTYWWIILIFLWALFVSYTRIYLGVHYPGDILAGACVGACFGFLFYKTSVVIARKVRGLRFEV
ncbi:MAG TPA: phosphatase PAP2 family protein [Ohtaekwangia sp.]|nr:phosphatase PAP2 family protein [Ohtaekwangia sp.]